MSGQLCTQNSEIKKKKEITSLYFQVYRNPKSFPPTKHLQEPDDSDYAFKQIKSTSFTGTGQITTTLAEGLFQILTLALVHSTHLLTQPIPIPTSGSTSHKTTSRKTDIEKEHPESIWEWD